ncbi:unnamed protein product [Phytophthora lilii]|uniref:Unnamed protein product n=1 Tax=Phytophthora lilii TaxID=2077276 RepID=A0A9W6TZA2_9STRA|nr:unnamed protein product [Phytophthora lilii]
MKKQGRLIEKQIESKRLTPDSVAMQQCMNLASTSKLTWNGNQVLHQCGLGAIATPATGNCQYYAVAMALLQREFSSEENGAAIENLAAKLKRGLVAASYHLFEEEFSSGIRQAFLSTLNTAAAPVPINQTAIELKAYLKELSQTTSKRNATIERRYWGNELTQRMMAEIIDGKIYVRASGLSKKESSALLTQRAGLKSSIQQELNESIQQGHCPIVILYQSEHYSWLRFKSGMNTDNCIDLQTPATPTDQLQLIPNRSQQVSGSTDKQEHQYSRNSSTSAAQPSILDLRSPEQREREEIEEFGGTRRQELQSFPTAGLRGLFPGKRRELRELNLADPVNVSKWIGQYEVSLETLTQWQQELQLEDSSSIYTTSTSPSSESTWSQADTEMAEPGQPEAEPLPPEQASGMGRFINQPSLHSRNLKQAWSALQAKWHHETVLPSLPGSTL